MRLAAGVRVRAVHAGQIGIVVVVAAAACAAAHGQAQARVVAVAEEQQPIGSPASAHCGRVEVVVVVVVEVAGNRRAIALCHRVQRQCNRRGCGGAVRRGGRRGLRDDGHQHAGTGTAVDWREKHHVAQRGRRRRCRCHWLGGQQAELVRLATGSGGCDCGCIVAGRHAHLQADGLVEVGSWKRDDALRIGVLLEVLQGQRVSAGE